MVKKKYNASLIPTAQELKCYSKNAIIGTLGSNLLLLAFLLLITRDARGLEIYLGLAYLILPLGFAVFLLGQPLAGLILETDPCRGS